MSGKRRKDDSDEDISYSGEDEYFSVEDKMALERHRRSGKRLENNEEELFAFDESDSDADENKVEEQEEDMESDIEGAKSDDDLPDVRAWGQSKRNFYSADYVDEDYGGLGAQEEEAAVMEEEEARNIQKRLVEQLEEADFSLDVFTTKKSAQPLEKEEHTKEQIKTDLSKLTKRQKVELLQKESPEFAGLLEEFKDCVKKLHEQLEPLKSLIVDGTIPPCPAADFITTQHELVLNYCSNLSYYLLLKARRTSVQAHPVVKRLVQYRQLLEQLQKNVSPLLEQQIANILELAAADKIHMEAPERPKKKLLKLLSKSEDINNFVNKQLVKQSVVPKLQDTSAPVNLDKDTDDSSQEEENGAEVESGEEKDGDEEERRGITYQIAKNKGLTPYRKKELRNPRVKHRMKFRKAKIRRKGQIREVRAELKRYGGELSGIKAGVSKSIKLK